MATVNKSYGEVTDATVEEREAAADKFAQEAAEKLKGSYSFRLVVSPSKKDPANPFVTVYINAKGGKKPGKIGFGKFATPRLFVDDPTDAEEFLNAATTAGLKLQANFPTET